MFKAVVGAVGRVGLTSLGSSHPGLGCCELLKNLPTLGAVSVIQPLQLQQLRLRHNVNRDLRFNFKFARERPIGPNKHRPPNRTDPRASKELDYRKKVHYPEDGKYTIKKLKMTKMGGRHPETGIKVIEGVGGGSKRKYRWIDWKRLPEDWPRDGSVLEERIITINYDPNRDAQIAMTGYQDKLRWQIATNKMKQGDIIRTFTDIPTIPIRPKEGDSHPLGALPVGTVICQVEAWPGEGAYFMTNAEEDARIMRKIDDRVVIKCWDRLEFAIPEEAQCVVGTNSIHPLRAMDIGSPNRMRWLGMRPRSGLFQKKTGRHGRKIKKMPPAIYTKPYAEFMKDVGTPSSRGIRGRTVLLTSDSEGKRGQKRASKRETVEGW